MVVVEGLLLSTVRSADSGTKNLSGNQIGPGMGIKQQRSSDRWQGCRSRAGDIIKKPLIVASVMMCLIP